MNLDELIAIGVQIDEADRPILAAFRWYLRNAKKKGSRYPFTTIRDKSGSRTVFMHQMLLPCNSGLVVDHIDGDGLNNRRSNLRLATQSQNGGNQRGTGGTSRHKGVTFHKGRGKWQVEITVNRRKRYLGLFECETAAAVAYNGAAADLFGEFARLNEITA